MGITSKKIVALVASAVLLTAVTAAPLAAAEASDTRAQVTQTAGNAQIVATPGPAAQEAAQNQQPFGAYPDALLYHH